MIKEELDSFEELAAKNAADDAAEEKAAEEHVHEPACGLEAVEEFAGA